VRALAAGEKDYEKYRKIFRENFVFLNVYTKSVAEEHDPRGPEGPYRFVDKSVPVLVFKRWNGETILQQLGFQPNPEHAKRSLAQIVDRVLKKHGPVIPPKALRPLLKRWEKAEKYLEKERTAPAIRELLKIVAMGADEKKFPEPPEVLAKARAALKNLEEAADEAIAKAKALEPEEAKKALRRIEMDYRGLEPVEKKVDAAKAALD